MNGHIRREWSWQFLLRQSAQKYRVRNYYGGFFEARQSVRKQLAQEPLAMLCLRGSLPRRRTIQMESAPLDAHVHWNIM
jgi:hypothetical protein